MTTGFQAVSANKLLGKIWLKQKVGKAFTVGMRDEPTCLKRLECRHDSALVVGQNQADLFAANAFGVNAWVPRVFVEDTNSELAVFYPAKDRGLWRRFKSKDQARP